MERKPFLMRGVLLLAASFFAAPCRAQNGGRIGKPTLTVSPNPSPIDGPLTIQGQGFPPSALLIFYWDQENLQSGSLLGSINLDAPSLIEPDATGSFSFTLKNLAAQVYPDDVGTHTITVIYTVEFPRSSAVAQVQLTPRQGWPTPPPLPQQSANTVSSGEIAYQKFSSDGNSTSLILTDGQSNQVMSSGPVGRGLVGQPAFSPDGSQLVFPAYLDTIPDINLYLENKNGGVTQLTFDGGSPPKATGGAAGSLSGAVLPFVAMPLTDVPDEDTCRNLTPDLNTNPDYPGSIHVNLVGTNFNTTALPAGAPGNVNYNFTLTGVPEGDYSLHAWSLIQVCQKDSQVNPKSGQPGQPEYLNVHQPAVAQPSFTVPVHVTAGGNTQVPTFALQDSYVGSEEPSWLDNQTLVFTKFGGSFQVVGGGVSDVFSFPLGGQPTELPNIAKLNGVLSVDASPANQKIAGYTVGFFGSFIADAADTFNTAQFLDGSEILLMLTNVGVSDDHFSWSPDGNYLAFNRRTNFTAPVVTGPNDVLVASIGGVVGDLWVKNVATGEEMGLTKYNIKGGEGVVGRPAWSPDLKQIAVTYTPDNMKTTNIRVVNVADGSHFDLTTDGLSAFPAWTGSGHTANFPVNGNFLPPPAAAPSGDLNGDGKVTIADAILGLDIAVGLRQPTPAELQAGDFQGTSRITVADVVKILELAVGLA